MIFRQSHMHHQNSPHNANERLLVAQLWQQSHLWSCDRQGVASLQDNEVSDLVGGAMCPSWKMMEFVNGFRMTSHIWNGKYHSCSKPPTRDWWYKHLYNPHTIWLFNIAMENDPFIDGLPIKNWRLLIRQIPHKSPGIPHIKISPNVRTEFIKSRPWKQWRVLGCDFHTMFLKLRTSMMFFIDRVEISSTAIPGS